MQAFITRWSLHRVVLYDISEEKASGPWVSLCPKIAEKLAKESGVRLPRKGEIVEVDVSIKKRK